MRVLFAVLSLAFIALAPSTAKAAELCNETSFVIEVASGWPVEGGVAIQGWERIRPGDCENLAEEVSLDSDQPVFFYAQTSTAYLGGVREWRGNVPLCVDETDFEVVASTRCAALGLASREFMMREGTQRERTVLVEPENFGSRAQIAGVQRLLESAGYAISSVDGYEGRGTRRAVQSFLSDRGLSARPPAAELIDTLEAYAIERNTGSGVTVCNDSIGDISAVIGHRVDDTWQSRGWWRLHSGECARVLADHLETANTYYYVERIMSSTGERTPINGGEQAFCIAPARFVAEGRSNCIDRGYATAQFRSIPDPENGGVRIHVEDSDFTEGADLNP